jgi:hypothetical protein
MEAIPVQASRRVDQPEGVVPPAASPIQLDLHRARQLAELLDAKFSVGGIRFGFDAIVGLIPGVGDVVTLLAGLYPLYVAQKHGVGLPTRARMLGNLLLDAGVGAVPLLGDLFDVAFKANLKNLRILEKALERLHRR